MDSSAESLCNAFTVDVEDYFQVSAFERNVDRQRWPEFESRVEANTMRIADLLDAANIRATFFVLGYLPTHISVRLRRRADPGFPLSVFVP